MLSEEALRAKTQRTLIEQSSMIGSAAAMCVERALWIDPGNPSIDRRQADYSAQRSAPPRAKDAVRPGLCRRCGFLADHRTAQECIDALRDRIAELTGKELRPLTRRSGVRIAESENQKESASSVDRPAADSCLR